MTEPRQKIERNKKLVQEYKATHPCVICGESRVPCLDFHHTTDDKLATINYLVRGGKGVHKLKEEMAKCIVVCANCHRIIHASEE